MQFISSIDQPSPLIAQPVNKPDLRPSAEFTKRTHTNGTARGAIAALVSDDANASEANNKDTLPFLRFPPLFSNDLGASAFLYPTPSVTNSKNYSEGLNPSASNDGFSIVCPTELHLDEILNNVEDTSNLSLSSNRAATPTTYVSCPQQPQEDAVMQLVTFVPPPAPVPEPRKTRRRASAAARMTTTTAISRHPARLLTAPLTITRQRRL